MNDTGPEALDGNSPEDGEKISIGYAAWRRLRPVWISLLMLGLILGISTSSIQEAQWLDNSRPLVNLLVWAMLFGVLVSRLRWPGWFAGVYTLFASVLFSLQTIGRVFPSLATVLSQTSAESSQGIRVRALNLVDRIASWSTSLRLGENITDTGLFVVVFGIILWAAAVWLAWCVLRRRRPLEGLIPLGLLLGINTYLSKQGTLYLWMYILFALLLVAHSAWQTLHEDWDRRHVDYPDDLGEWVFGASIMTMLIVSLVYLLPYVATPNGWDLISKWTRPVRETAAQTTERLFADVNPAEVVVYAPLAVTPNLQSIGAPVETSTDTVMYVTISDPPPPAPQLIGRVPSPPQHYWRNEILTTYNGTGWEPAKLQAIGSIPGLTGEAPNGRYALEQTFDVVARHTEQLFAANEPVTPGEGTALRYAQPDNSTLVAGKTSKYSVTSYATRVTAVALRGDTGAYPPAILTTYTQLPASLPERVRNMADRVVGRANNAYDMAMAIQTYLRETYPYNLKVAPPPPGRDAVDYFLYEAQEGFCSYFSSAMAVMLRSEGVPARVVTGYATGEYDTQRRAYRVPLSASHAWVEVYFPSYGWVEFEPTPALSVFDYPESGAMPPIEQARTTPEEAAGGVSLFANPLALAAGGILLAALLAFAGARLPDAWRGRKEMRLPVNQASGLYWEVRRALARSGMRTGASTTPSEFLAAYGPSLAGRARLYEAVQLATSLYQQARYSPVAPDLNEISSARRAWREAFRERVKLRVGIVWRKLKPTRSFFPHYNLSKK